MPLLTRLIARRLGPVGLALTALDMWRRIPPEQRRQLVNATKTHGPRLAKNVAARRRRTPPPAPPRQ